MAKVGEYFGENLIKFELGRRKAELFQSDWCIRSWSNRSPIHIPSFHYNSEVKCLCVLGNCFVGRVCGDCARLIKATFCVYFGISLQNLYRILDVDCFCTTVNSVFFVCFARQFYASFFISWLFA